MEDGTPGRRRSSSQANGRGPGLYRLNSNQSSTSIFEDVEMAQDEVRFFAQFCLFKFEILAETLRCSYILDPLPKVYQRVCLRLPPAEPEPIRPPALCTTTMSRRKRG